MHRNNRRPTSLSWTRNGLIALAVALLLSPLLPAREIMPLDADWRFHRGDISGASADAFEDSGWQTLDVPHDWSIGLPKDHAAATKGDGGFIPTGTGWYRRSFDAPGSWKDRRVRIEFDGVYMNAEVWINGVSLGRHPYGYTRFRLDLTPHLRSGGRNTLAVRVDNTPQPSSRWYSGSGIHRHVRLVVTAPVHVAADGVFLRTLALSPKSATLKIERELRNETDAPARVRVETTVIDPSGRDVARARSDVDLPARGRAAAPAEVTIGAPRPWSPDTPHLYRAVTRVLANRRAVDEVTTTFGVRTVRVSAARGFELNGSPLHLVGGNVHHDNGPLGAAAFDAAEERRVRLLKAAGFNAVRTAHNPPSPAFLDACDRLGLLVLDEAFDGWERKKTKEDYGTYFKDWWQRDLEAMVLADRNRPSVVMWSIGNEMYERGSAAGLRIAQELTARIRELDPSRPVTAGVNGPGKNGDWTKFDPLFATMEVAGYNYELGRHPADHARVPDRVILVTESYQSETFAVWAACQDVPYVIGDFVWSGMDYLGEAGIGRVFNPGEPIVKHWEGDMWPWHGAACGDIDLTGWRKPISHYRAIVWDRGEKLHAAVRQPSPDGKPWGVSPWTVEPALPSWTWPGHEGKTLAVEVYSRHDQVRLYAGGKLVGEKPTTRAEEFKALFTLPYTPGELKAVGMKGGREVETFSLHTAGAAARLVLAADRKEMRGDGQDLCFVTTEIADATGVWHPQADRPVRFEVSGPASIAGIGNADLTTFEGYRQNPHRTYQGRVLLVLRSKRGERGRVTVTASADGLAPAKVNVEVKR